MPALTADALAKELAAGRFQPLYLIVGDDEREKDRLAAAIAAAVPEDVQAFALERLSALETDPAFVAGSARSLPFLGDRRVIIVTRAEKWFTGRKKAGAADAGDAVEPPDEPTGGLEALEAYFEEPDPMATIAFVAADVNRTLRVVKALVKRAAVIECWGLKSEKEPRGGFAVSDALQKAGRLVQTRLRQAGLAIDRHALEPLLAHAGTDIGTLCGDLDRLVLYCHGQKAVTVEDVQAVVSGAALVDQWSIVNAIERGDAREALRQLALAIESGEVPFKTLGQIGWFVRSRMAESASAARVTAAIDALFRTDLAMKSSGGEPRVLLERLIVELCADAGGRPAPAGRRPPSRGGQQR